MHRSTRWLVLVILVVAALGGPWCAADAASNRPATIDVQLLAINDFHGNLEPPGGSSGLIDGVLAGGATYLAAHIAALCAANPAPTFVVSAGDIVGASPLLSALFHDEPAIELMNLIGLDLSVVGDHEFDEGIAELRRLQRGGCHPVDGCNADHLFRGAAFDYLAANVVRGSHRKPLFRGYRIKRLSAGVRVAFIGVTLQGTPTLVGPANVDGWSFIDEADAVNAIIPRLRRRGIEAIVVLIHDGSQVRLPHTVDGCDVVSGAFTDIVQRLDPAVDLVISGHTHQAYNCIVGGIPVTSAASFGRVVTDIDMTIDTTTRDVAAMTIDNVIVTRDVSPDPVVADLVDRYNVAVAPIANRPVGQITADITRNQAPSGEQAMGDVVADAQLAATRNVGAQMAFANAGGVRAGLVYASSGGEGNGVVTYAEAFSVQPFSFRLVTMTLTGSQIEQLLEQQFCGANAVTNRVHLPSAGFHYVYDLAGPHGPDCTSSNVVSSITLNGTPIDPAASYRVTVNSFLADGGDGATVLRDGTDRVIGPVDVDALAAHLTAASPLSPPALDRITRAP